MITLEHVYWLSGAMVAAYAVLSARDATNTKRFGNAAFWGLLAASFLFGSVLSDFANGLLALAWEQVARLDFQLNVGSITGGVYFAGAQVTLNNNIALVPSQIWSAIQPPITSGRVFRAVRFTISLDVMGAITSVSVIATRSR